LLIETGTFLYDVFSFPASIISTAPSYSSDGNIPSFLAAVLHSAPPGSNLTLFERIYNIAVESCLDSARFPSPTSPHQRISFMLRKTSMSTCGITIGSRKRSIVRSLESNVSRRWSLPVVLSCDEVQSNVTDFKSYKIFSAEIRELRRSITRGLNESSTIGDVQRISLKLS